MQSGICGKVPKGTVQRSYRHMDRRIRGKGSDGTMQYNADFTHTYYHCDSRHIIRKNPVFDGKVFMSTQLDLTPEQQSVVIDSGVEMY